MRSHVRNRRRAVPWSKTLCLYMYIGSAGAGTEFCWPRAIHFVSQLKKIYMPSTSASPSPSTAEDTTKPVAAADPSKPVNGREETPPFSIGMVEPVEPPTEGEGKYWCKYTIVQGSSTITGYRKGGVKAVRKDVNEIVADMNQRRMGKRGRVHLTPSSKKAATPPSKKVSATPPSKKASG
jgi:hypothetical protein